MTDSVQTCADESRLAAAPQTQAQVGFAAPISAGDLLVAEYGQNDDEDCRILQYDAFGDCLGAFAS